MKFTFNQSLFLDTKNTLSIAAPLLKPFMLKSKKITLQFINRFLLYLFLISPNWITNESKKIPLNLEYYQIFFTLTLIVRVMV